MKKVENRCTRVLPARHFPNSSLSAGLRGGRQGLQSFPEILDLLPPTVCLGAGNTSFGASPRVCPHQLLQKHIFSAQPLLKSPPPPPPAPTPPSFPARVHLGCASALNSTKPTPRLLLSKHSSPAFARAHAHLKTRSDGLSNCTDSRPNTNTGRLSVRLERAGDRSRRPAEVF